jgi:predicted PurR-regulated permease PerM
MTMEPPTAEPAGQHRVPFWLVSLGAISWRVLAIAGLGLVVVGVAFLIGTVTASVVVAGVASVAVLPVVRRLRSRGWGAGKAAAVGTLLAFGSIILVLAAGAILLVRYAPDVIAAITAGLAALGQDETNAAVPAGVAAAIAGIAGGGTSWLAQNAGEIVASVSSLFSILLFGAFTTFYLLAGDTGWWPWLTQGLNEGERTSATIVGEAGAQRLGEFIRRTAVLSAARAVTTVIILVVFGIPFAIPLGTLVFAVGFVPYVGPLVAAGAVLLVALGSVGTGSTVLILVLMLVAHVATRRLVDRLFHGAESDTNPAIIIVALLVGAYIAGVIGLILAGPVAVALVAAGKTLRAERLKMASVPAIEGTLVPPWLDLIAGWSWRLLVALALLAVAFIPLLVVPLLLVPLIVAAVLAATLAPGLAALVRRGWGRSVSAAVLTVALAGSVIALTILAIAILVANIGSLASQVDSGADSVDKGVGGLGGLLTGFTGGITSQVSQTVLDLVAGVVGLTVVIAVGVVLTFIALRDGREGWTAATQPLAPWRRRIADSAAERAVSVLGGYMLATGAVSIFGALTQFVLMLILGVPLALPVFVLSVFAGYIPYIGGLITTGMALLLTITTGNPVAILIMAIFTVVFNIVQGNVIQPLVFSRAVHIHPAIILLAIPAGNALGGILGMFLVVPILGVIATSWRSVLEIMGPPPNAQAEVPAGEARPEPTGGAPA